MKHNLTPLLLASALATTSLTANAAGFRHLTVVDPGHPDLTVGLWYPSDVAPPTVPNTEYELPVALNAPLSKTPAPLIVLSHGFGGWYAGHADTAIALADSGFIVAAPSHTGNTWSDMSSTVDRWLLDRPRHISSVIDHLLENNELAANINSDDIGVYGFSAGGYTALSLIGAVPDLDHAKEICQQQPDEFVCKEGLLRSMREAGMQHLPADAWGADPRIKAAAIAAPGLGFAYTSASLGAVTADVQLWSGELDQSVPTATNAASLAKNLPNPPETHWVDKANHFAFMVVSCRDAFKQEDPDEYEMVCVDVEGFDRRKFHDDMHREMVRFYRESFNINN